MTGRADARPFLVIRCLPARRPREWIDRGQWGSQARLWRAGEGGWVGQRSTTRGVGAPREVGGRGPGGGEGGASTTTPEAQVVVVVGVAGSAQPSRRGRRATYNHRACGVGARRSCRRQRLRKPGLGSGASARSTAQGGERCASSVARSKARPGNGNAPKKSWRPLLSLAWLEHHDLGSAGGRSRGGYPTPAPHRLAAPSAPSPHPPPRVFPTPAPHKLAASSVGTGRGRHTEPASLASRNLVPQRGSFRW